jgi:predicted O-methyltransferase YrrM
MSTDVRQGATPLSALTPGHDGRQIHRSLGEACPVLQRVLNSGQIQGASGKQFRNLGPMSTRSNMQTIWKLCQEERPERTLEVGFAFGGSALTFASAHQAAGHHDGPRHVAIDPFQKTVWDNVGLNLLKEAQLSEFVVLHESLSSSALPQLLDGDLRFDMIYIDGSHLFEDVFVDFYYCLRLLNPEGILLFDDSTDAHVAKVLRFIRANLGEHLQPMDLSRFRETRLDRVKVRWAQRLRRCQLSGFRKTSTGERAWDASFHAF